ncbi:MAG: MFS transporter [Alphaproteobacteria bacterium]|nr:MFS transporter [Alphaproteobacteria bacterium]MBV9200025.1 MFS transporter [Alphaproteobacteria bacterium]
MDINVATGSLPWYRSLSRQQWGVLVASNLGWLFDGFELYALFLTVGFALHQLLDAAQYNEIPRYAGYILATTVFGWATGGVIGGVIADYIGRKRTMILAILAYSLTTGLSALAWNWLSFAVLRFLVGVAIGSEWATGASIVSELWPDHARGKGGGLLQCGAGIGGILASGVWLAVGGVGPNAWRWMYLIGVLPALATFWIRRGIPESPRWEAVRERRYAAHALRRTGAPLEGENVALTRFTVVDLFADRAVRRPLICAFVMMLSVTFAFWGVGTFIPTYVGSAAAKSGLSAPYWSAWAGLITSICGVAGFISLGFLADNLGRKPAAMLFYFMCLVLTPIVYLWAWNFTVLLLCVGIFGFFSLGIWAWAPIWLPELFPTRMRGTAVAFCFNAPRFISCIGPVIAGTLIVSLGGYGPAATIVGLFFILGLAAAPFLPETKGKPLPETLTPALRAGAA